LLSYCSQIIFPLLESLWGAGKFDGLRLSLTHINLQGMMTKVCVWCICI
jgi:hypothetical protein